MVCVFDVKTLRGNERIQLHVGGHTHHLFGEVHGTGELSQLFLIQTQCLCQIHAVTLMTSSRDGEKKMARDTHTVAIVFFNHYW